MADKIKFDVVMPHNNWQGVRRALETFRKYTPQDRIGKVIFIDQNPEYQKVDDLVDLHIFTHGQNLGFAKSMNLGIRLSDAPYVMCTNDDVEFLNPQWVEGVEETFSRYSTALCVNPGSPRNPRASGDAPINAPGYDYKEEWTTEQYNEMVINLGKGHIIDGICMFCTIFHRERLDKVFGVIPGKVWFDERFASGGEDYDMNRRGFMTKIPENNFGGYRSLGTNLAYIWHWWYSTKKEDTGQPGVKYDGGRFIDKWRGTLPQDQNPDIYGHNGLQTIPQNIIRQW